MDSVRKKNKVFVQNNSASKVQRLLVPVVDRDSLRLNMLLQQYNSHFRRVARWEITSQVRYWFNKICNAHTHALNSICLLDNAIVLPHMEVIPTVSSECFPYKQIIHLKLRIIHFWIGKKDRSIKFLHAAQYSWVR